MTIETHPYPGLFGGVSQQVPAMRHPTQCAEQENGLATVVDGLFKRPGTLHTATLDFPYGAGQAYGHVIDRGAVGRSQLILVNGKAGVFDLLTGTPQAVTLGPTAAAYLTTADPAEDFRAITVADYTFIVNRSKVVQKANAIIVSPPNQTAYVNIKTANPATTYTISVDSGSASYLSGTPTTSHQDIAVGLAAACAAAFGAAYTVTVIPKTNVVKITRGGVPITCSASDSWSNNTMTVLSNGVEKYTDLPARFETGYVIAVSGTAETSKDAYYVQWDGSRWVETTRPSLENGLDPATMPHQLLPDGLGGWTLAAATWATRLVGDTTTAPMPSFVGRTINNVFFHRNRLGFLSGDSASLSRAGSYFNFFPSSGSQVLPTDPIDLSATSAEVQSLEWTTTFNENLIIWAADKQQFSLVGSQVLSPEDARLQPTTTFEASMATAPVSIGNKVLFTAKLGGAAQLNLYRLSDNSTNNYSEDLTEHVPSYVPEQPRAVVPSMVSKTAVVIPRGPSASFHVFKWEFDERDRISQKAWQRFTLGGSAPVTIVSAYWVSRRLHLLLWVASELDPLGGHYMLRQLDLDWRLEDLNASMGIRLDDRAVATVGAFDGTRTSAVAPVLAPPGELVWLQCRPGLEPMVLTPTFEAPNGPSMSTNATFMGDLTGSTVWVGRRFLFRYTFNDAVLTDSNGVPVMSATVKLVRTIVHFADTGFFKALVQPLLRALYTYPAVGRLVGLQSTASPALGTGEFSIPVHTTATGTLVSIESDSHMPIRLPYAEWVGDVTRKAYRK